MPTPVWCWTSRSDWGTSVRVGRFAGHLRMSVHLLVSVLAVAAGRRVGELHFTFGLPLAICSSILRPSLVGLMMILATPVESTVTWPP